LRNLRFVACAVALLLVASGCGLWKSANRYAASPGTISEPFWCTTTPGTALSVADCQNVSGALDLAVVFANAHHTAGTATGATAGVYSAGSGAPFRFSGPTAAFDAGHPDTLLYDGISASAQVAGIEWNVASGASAPAGFVGLNDAWDDQGGGVWRLRAWILRPFQNEVNVFADTHPCLGLSSAVYSLTAVCYTATHPNPLRILVTNDDGYSADGIDFAVEALRVLPLTPAPEVTVSAPLIDRSGSGGTVSPDPLTVTDVFTDSGYPAKAVDGYPADSVRYALKTMHVSPDLLVSGINRGQNLGPIIAASGTVGAARVGGRDDIPSVALSQGLAPPLTPDYDISGVAAMLEWVDDFLLGRAGPALFQKVVNINIPTCPPGTVRETLFLPAAVDISSGNPITGVPNCESTLVNPVDDIAGFLNGFVTVSSIGT
jgi:5'-nucleotidase